MKNFAVFLRILFWIGFILLFIGFVSQFVSIGIANLSLSLIGLYVIMVSPISVAFYVFVVSLRQKEYLLAFASLLLIAILAFNIMLGE
ncbi:hypothetical protein [Hippea jasoniae]|uniref:hypothetical protein n=1 Tax=Hippea jasoniae TaxID=944479 RepID=UPI00054CF451|nr:hypothetical protein [Hippea jasoniae]